MTTENLITFSDLAYPEKRKMFRDYAQYDEIGYALDTISDEVLNYSPDGTFCKVMERKYQPAFEKYRNTLADIFDGNNAWLNFRKFLIDGYLAFEIIWNEGQTEVIGLKELDPVSLVPAYDNGTRIWIQHQGEEAYERRLYDSQVAYISFQGGYPENPISYIDRLIRPFNILKTMEDAAVVSQVTPTPITLDSMNYMRGHYVQATGIPNSYWNFERWTSYKPLNESDIPTGIKVERDDIKFQKRIKRYQDAFQELLLKPFWLQMKVHDNDLMPEDIRFRYHGWNK